VETPSKKTLNGRVRRWSRWTGPLLVLACALGVAVPAASARRAVVTDRDSDAITIFDSGSGSLIAPLIGTGAGKGTEPFGLAITPDGATAYANAQSGPEGTEGGSISAINLGAGSPAAQITSVGIAPVGIAITPNGKRAYFASRGSATVSMIDIATNLVIGPPIKVGIEGESADRGVAITPDGSRVYVARFGDDLVSVIDTATNTLVGAPIPVGDGPRELAVTPDGKRIYVTDFNDSATGNSVSVIDTATNTVVGAPIPVGKNPRGIAITPDGSRAYVANNEDGTVSVIDTATNTVIGSPIPAGTNPVGVAVTPDGSRALVADESPAPNNLIFPISTATDTALPSFPSGGEAPAEIAVVPNQPPKAAFTASHATKKPTVESFNGSASSDPDGSVTRFDWNFGDGQSLANGGPTPNHTYTKPGAYTATLALTDNEGCSTRFVFTGQTASCNGSAVAAASQAVGIPPQTGFSKHPKKKTTSQKAKFKFKADEPGARFQCKLDRRKFKKCGKKFKATVEPGTHRLQVRAIGAGGADPTPAKFKWSVLPH
jgi:YVTN family beta-propeller protein